MKKTNFLLYKDNLEAVLGLTDLEAGQLFKAIYSWVNGRKVYEIEDVKARTIFDFVFKKHLENDLIKYKEQCDINSKNGQKGGRPKKAKEPNGLLNNRSKAKKGDKGIDTDIDNEIDKGTKDIKKKFNDIVGLSTVKKIIGSRLKSLNARIKEYSFDEVVEVLDNVSESDFLKGDNDRQWKCNFDWIMNPNNFVKILEGNYKNKKAIDEFDYSTLD